MGSIRKKNTKTGNSDNIIHTCSHIHARVHAALREVQVGKKKTVSFLLRSASLFLLLYSLIACPCHNHPQLLPTSVYVWRACTKYCSASTQLHVLKKLFT
jgi:hypothetical protein